MKILILNGGSSSLKYHLLDMDSDEAVFQGNVSNIGIDGSMHTYSGQPRVSGKDPAKVANHEEALELAFRTLLEKHTVREDELSVVGIESSMAAIDFRGPQS